MFYLTLSLNSHGSLFKFVTYAVVNFDFMNLNIKK